VSFLNRKGCLSYLVGQARINTTPGSDPANSLEVNAPPPLNAFGFSDGSLVFQKLDNKTLAFGDAAGRYRLALQDVIGADGNLNRAFGHRLTTADTAPAGRR
jgi:hypothetical protein